MTDGPISRIWRTPPNLDADRLIQFVQREVSAAAQGWKNGDPQDEVAFMNRLTELLKKRRRQCDVGKTKPMKAKSSTYVLHRKGTRQMDQFGADLAVTLDVGETWRKTAIFQLKKCRNYEVSLNADDLKGAKEDPRIAERSFVLAIDEERLGVRLQKTEVLQEKFAETKTKSQVFDANGWIYLHDWLSRWLRCELSPRSVMNDAAGVEGLLEAFRKKPIEVDESYPFEPGDVRHLEMIPARVWLQSNISEPAKK
jgi:hypothetical protein